MKCERGRDHFSDGILKDREIDQIPVMLVPRQDSALSEEPFRAGC